MPMEIVVETDDRPGIIAEIGEVFGHARLNIKAAAAFAHGGRGYLHFVVDDADRALATLKVAGWKVRTTREVLVVSLDDRPGELGRYARRLSDAGINIAAFYMAGERAGEKELIVAVDDVASARRA
ncbi:MAG: ACT domain-containing protein [Chloroflexi bacterium]|nr:MAG: ACT domain-containing protein [Chloroflexota bacterium]TMF59725.1 MAG: ACT domain-containing protein [Chloroflexota bacterium]TMG39337.1 MAG: ACT domain-containing protein [Chloroflexota bacterium]